MRTPLIRRITVLAILALLCLSLFNATHAQDDTGSTPESLSGQAALITYQGSLRNSGLPANGAYNLTFVLYDHPTAGTVRWTEFHASVPVTDGLFTVLLGGSTPFGNVFRSYNSLYMHILVNGTPLSPRQPMTGVPYAFNAEHSGTGLNSFIGGGPSHDAAGDYSTVSGGNNNTASNTSATVSGGNTNTASGTTSTVGGGFQNTATNNGAAVGGGYSNAASGTYAAIAGGHNGTALGNYSSVGGGEDNIANYQYSVVGGGFTNLADNSYATVAGGSDNTASGQYSTVSGGTFNVATATGAMIPGGYNNHADGAYSLAAGRQARADHHGVFVWADNLAADVGSTADNQFIARARGGVWFYTNNTLTTGATLPTGGGSWASVSDRAVKDNITAVDSADILAAVVNMPISTWNYDSQDESIRHIGPMAQDFHAAFGVGEDDRHITTVDADGVALAAIQGLYAENQELKARIDALEHGGTPAALSSNPLLLIVLALAAGLGGSLVGAFSMQRRMIRLMEDRLPHP